MLGGFVPDPREVPCRHRCEKSRTIPPSQRHPTAGTLPPAGQPACLLRNTHRPGQGRGRQRRVHLWTDNIYFKRGARGGRATERASRRGGGGLGSGTEGREEGGGGTCMISCRRAAITPTECGHPRAEGTHIRPNMGTHLPMEWAEWAAAVLPNGCGFVNCHRPVEFLSAGSSTRPWLSSQLTDGGTNSHE